MPEKDESDFYKQVLDNVYDGIYFVDRDRRITYWNSGAERITGFKAFQVVGKHCRDNVLVHADGRGINLCATEACPAVKVMDEGGDCEAEVYLRHMNGYRVPILTRISPLKDAGGSVIGAVEIFSDNSARLAARNQIEQLERLALLDQLTGLGNRRHAEVHLKARLGELERYGWPFGLLYFDIDHFKNINDAYGHDTGDEVLKVVARTAEGSIRYSDFVSRWGGEEFTANIENAGGGAVESTAEKLRRLVEQSAVLKGRETIKVTVSIGATVARPGDTIEELVKRADGLMYQSKQSGRNRVTVG